MYHENNLIKRRKDKLIQMNRDVLFCYSQSSLTRSTSWKSRQSNLYRRNMICVPSYVNVHYSLKMYGSKKNIEFEVDIEERMTIEADEGLLELVWTNPLSNAMKFTLPGGTITLSQVSDKEGVTVSVADTGCGKY